jgi:hypothetical protein
MMIFNPRDSCSDQFCYCVVVVLNLVNNCNFTFPGVFQSLRPRTFSLVVGDSDDSDELELEFPCTVEDKEIQTDWSGPVINQNVGPAAIRISSNKRSVEECQNVLANQGPEVLTDEEVVDLVDARHLAAHQLEKVLEDAERGVRIRRQLMGRVSHPHFASSLQQVPYASYDYSKVCYLPCIFPYNSPITQLT